MSYSLKQHGLVFLGLALYAVAMRFFSFFPSVIDHDESTYLLIADYLMNGATYQVDVIDTKPIGVFWLLGGVQWLFGTTNIFMHRLVAALVVSSTGFFLYRAHLRMGHTPGTGITSGVAYILVSSIFTHFGVSPNTETYLCFFTALALWGIAAEERTGRWFLAGLLLGMGFIIKYVNLFDGFGFGFLLLWSAFLGHRSWYDAWKKGLVLGVGLAVPFIALCIWYWQQGAFESFWFHSITVSGRYPKTRVPLDYVKYVFADFFPRFLPVTLLYFYVLFSKTTPILYKGWFWAWSILVWFIILMPGNHYWHYSIQFMVPFAFIAGYAFESIPTSSSRFWSFLARPRYYIPLLGIILVANTIIQKKDYYDKPDYPRQLQSWLQPRLKPNDQIYLANIHQVVYLLVDRPCPIPYTHHSLFWEERHVKALEIDVQEQLTKIFNAKPEFVILNRPLKDNRLEAWLREKYTLSHTMGKDSKTEIYKRLTK